MDEVQCGNCGWSGTSYSLVRDELGLDACPECYSSDISDADDDEDDNGDDDEPERFDDVDMFGGYDE